MKRRWTGIYIVLAMLWLAGCNSEDVHNLGNDTKKIGQDIAPMVSGAALATKVNTHLTLHKGIDMSGLHIETRDRSVTISGHVRDSHMKQVVIDTVTNTTGVDHVDASQLRVENK
jgi:osmotically-inducible protein OsmY